MKPTTHKNCGGKLKIVDKWTYGKEYKCNRCGSTFVVYHKDRTKN